MKPNEIKELRGKLKLTQLQMAVRLKVDPGTLARWERGERSPVLQSIRKLNRLARKVNNNG